MGIHYWVIFLSILLLTLILIVSFRVYEPFIGFDFMPHIVQPVSKPSVPSFLTKSGCIALDTVQANTLQQMPFYSQFYNNLEFGQVSNTILYTLSKLSAGTPDLQSGNINSNTKIQNVSVTPTVTVTTPKTVLNPITGPVYILLGALDNKLTMYILFPNYQSSSQIATDKNFIGATNRWIYRILNDSTFQPKTDKDLLLCETMGCDLSNNTQQLEVIAEQLDIYAKYGENAPPLTNKGYSTCGYIYPQNQRPTPTDADKASGNPLPKVELYSVYTINQSDSKVSSYFNSTPNQLLSNTLYANYKLTDSSSDIKSENGVYTFGLDYTTGVYFKKNGNSLWTIAPIEPNLITQDDNGNQTGLVYDSFVFDSSGTLKLYSRNVLTSELKVILSVPPPSGTSPFIIVLKNDGDIVFIDSLSVSSSILGKLQMQTLTGAGIQPEDKTLINKLQVNLSKEISKESLVTNSKAIENNRLLKEKTTLLQGKTINSCY